MNATVSKIDWTNNVFARVRRACLLEATARKLGNVHPGQALGDLAFQQFATSAEALAIGYQNRLSQPGPVALGELILAGAHATRAAVNTNTNLGINLLLAPLVLAEICETPLAAILETTTVHDSESVYRAIRLMEPGGMGKVAQQDLSETPTQPLVALMNLARDRDTIALQYATNFQLVQETVLPLLMTAAPVFSDSFEPRPKEWECRVLFAQGQLLATVPDTLIERKCGPDAAGETMLEAQALKNKGWPGSKVGWEAWRALDGNLRSAFPRRNPGTTADLLAAGLFLALAQLDFPAGPSDLSCQ